jgi:thiamine-phosphate diphosphorylase
VRALPRLHLVTDDRIVRSPGFHATAEALLHAGKGRVALHLRAPGLPGRDLFDLAASLSDAARAAGAPLLVNDRVDVALAVGADGVQLGARGLAPADARLLVGPGRWIGASAHSAAAAADALDEGADFVLAGTLFASASHAGRVGQGVEWLRAIPGGSERVIGIGGVSLERVGAVAAVAHGVAVIRAVWDSARPVDALRDFLDALHERDAE